MPQYASLVLTKPKSYKRMNISELLSGQVHLEQLTGPWLAIDMFNFYNTPVVRWSWWQSKRFLSSTSLHNWSTALVKSRGSPGKVSRPNTQWLFRLGFLKKQSVFLNSADRTEAERKNTAGVDKLKPALCVVIIAAMRKKPRACIQNQECSKEYI